MMDEGFGEGFMDIPTGALVPSLSNPPGRAIGPEFDELVESVRRHGVLQPIVVRRHPKDRMLWEIIAGHRRAAAAERAGLRVVPAVAQSDDVNVREIQLEENLRRKDLHALEEAQGYSDLMRETQETVAGVAARLGRSVRYVYDRLNLLKLRPELQEIFRAGEITPGHAIILARLSPADQKRVLDTDLFLLERSLFGPEEDGLRKQEPRKAISVRELQCWVDEHVRIAPATTDPILFPETVAALADADTVIPITYSYQLRESARSKERTFGPQSWKRADGEHKSKPCELAVTGLVVAGPHRGEAFAVCVKREKCKVHWGAEMRAKAKRAAEGGTRRPVNEEVGFQKRDPELEKRLETAEAAAQREIDEKVLAAVATMSQPDLYRFVLGCFGWAARCVLAEMGFVAERKRSVGANQKDVDLWLKEASLTDLAGVLALVATREGDLDCPKTLGIDASGILKQAAKTATATYLGEKKAKEAATRPKKKPAKAKPKKKRSAAGAD